MGMRIQQLPSALANQIAAGEVIERPASVVKELLENSLDAGATNIAIEIGYGGLNQIKISDNGSGIVAEDLVLAVAPHATSKISTFNDLYSIDTMGFRGEALASIASVSRLSISSRTPHQEHAMMLQVEGSSAMDVAPCARNVGTTIDVVDLFFNAPVRKRFLKSQQLEFQAIELVIKRFALSAPHIGLTLKHNNKLVLTLPAANNEPSKQQRISKIFGTQFIQEAVYLDVANGGMRLYGWLSGSAIQRSQNDRQWVYINQRMVKDKLINHALKQAYEGLLYPGRFPACLLYFSLSTTELDVNVHPTKHEVRFQQPRLVHDFFTSQITKALGTQATQSMDLEKKPEAILAMDAWEGKDLLPNTPDYTVSSALREPYPYVPEFKSSFSNTVKPASSIPWIILHDTYVLIFDEKQPLLVDAWALMQHWLSAELAQKSLPWEHRPLLVPVCISVKEVLLKHFNELQSTCALLGLIMEAGSNNQVWIRSIPIEVPYLDLQLFVDYLHQLETFEPAQLIEALSLCQRFDPQQLSVEERFALHQFVLKAKEQNSQHKGWYKPLLIEDCRNFLYD